MATEKTYILAIDEQMFAQQRMELNEMISNMEVNSVYGDTLQGIQNLLDSISDQMKEDEDGESEQEAQDKHLSGYLLGNTEHVEKMVKMEQEVISELSSSFPQTWDFVEKYYPNYSTSHQIKNVKDLLKIITDRDNLEEGSVASQMWDNAVATSNLDRSIAYGAIVRLYHTELSAVYEKTISNYIAQKGEL